MPRKRTSNLHLPANMVKRGPTYYFQTRGQYTNLGRDYSAALIQYASMVGERHKIMAVADLLAAYIEARRGKLAPATIGHYLVSAKNLGAVFGAMPIEQVTRAHVYEYVKRRGDVQANRDRALLSAAYTFATNIGAFTGPNPAMGLRERNTETPRTRYITDTELTALLLASSPRLACMIRFLYLTGMRPSDAFAIREDQFDAQGILFEASKTGKLSGVAWSDELRAVVQDARKLFRRFGRVYLFETKPRGTQAVHGPRQYTARAFRSLMKAAATKAGIRDIRPYDLRRKAGSDVTEGHAQSLLGHSTAKTTRQHYRAKPEYIDPVK